MQRHISLKPQQFTALAPMLWNEPLLSPVDVVCPVLSPWHNVELKPLPVFHSSIIDFIAELSRRLLALANSQPDLAALGFFLRPAALKQAVQKRQHNDITLMPLGLTFHLVPSNVPTVAFYSWLAALLQGNSAVVRLSSRRHPVQEAMLSLLNQMFNEIEWQNIGSRVRFVRYQHNDAITEYFSALCYSRVIWGGDTTIRDIRKIPLSVKAKELCFPDRKSVAVLESDYLATLPTDEWDRLILRLGQDISQFNQQACASPVLLIWIGEPQAELWLRFWSALAGQFSDEFADKLEQTINLQLAACTGWFGQMTSFGSLTVGEINYPANVNQCQFGFGLLAYQIVKSAEDWFAQAAAFQTCVYVGADKTSFAETATNSMTMRIDRICPAGQALAFDWMWDGEDLLQAFSHYMMY